MVDRLRDTAVRGVLVGRGALRNPWIFEQAQALAAGRVPREVPAAERAQFLLEYIDLLLQERSDEAAGFRHVAPGQEADAPAPGARPRAVGDQQAARAELLVHEGPGQRLSPARRDQRRRVDRAAAGDHQEFFVTRACVGGCGAGLKSGARTSGDKSADGRVEAPDSQQPLRCLQLHHLVVVRE